MNLNKKHLKIARILVQKIKNEGNIITYKELANSIGMDVSSASLRRELGGLLGDLSSYSFDNGMPLISALVVRKDADRPGNGFYTLYEEKKGIKIKDKDIVFIDELNKILQYDNWDRLIELLEETTSFQHKFEKSTGKNFELKHILNEKKYVDFIEIDEFELLESMEFEEGEQVERIITTRKRNSKARQMKIEQFKKDNGGKVFCEVCHESDLLVLDVHHDSIQVCDMGDLQKTKLNDLRVLCANCHRKVHGYKISVEELKEKLKN